MIRSTQVKAGLALTLTASVIAGGPAIADALGLGATAPAAHSAAWETSAARDAGNATQSNAAVRDAVAERKAQEKREARAKAKAAAERKAEAARKAEAKRKAEKARAARKRAAGGSPAQNRALGMAMCADKGWSAGQCADLGQLWQKESGWSSRAHNPSGAHGIPQALPGAKMSSHGSDWSTSARTQIAWGLDYIKGSYGNPSNAWGHSQSRGWY